MIQCIDEMRIQRHDEEMNIHTRIRHRRQQLGLTMQEVAIACGVSWQAVQRWETTAAPKRSNLVLIARALNIGVEWLITGQGPMCPQTPVDFSRLSGVEAQLVMHFRAMSEPHKDHLLSVAHTLCRESIDEFGGFLVKPPNPRNTAAKSKKVS